MPIGVQPVIFCANQLPSKLELKMLFTNIKAILTANITSNSQQAWDNVVLLAMAAAITKVKHKSQPSSPQEFITILSNCGWLTQNPQNMEMKFGDISTSGDIGNLQQAQIWQSIAKMNADSNIELTSFLDGWIANAMDFNEKQSWVALSERQDDNGTQTARIRFFTFPKTWRLLISPFMDIADEKVVVSTVEFVLNQQTYQRVQNSIEEKVQNILDWKKEYDFTP